MLEHAQEVLAWVGAHPHGALVLLFFVAMVDSLFIIGAFIPAAIILFAMGALVALGTLDLAPTALVAAIGTLFGDGFSFLLGRRYGDRLFEGRILRRYPELVIRGRAFFARNGGKSVALARFLGPLRAITPAIAGAAGMSFLMFLTVDFFAAYVWALVYLIPGVVFGASLGLAAEVAARLAGLLVATLVLVMVLLWVSAWVIRVLNRHAETWLRGLLEWSRRHRGLGRFGPGLADPDQPETPALAAVALLLLLLGGAWLGLLGGAGHPGYPGPVDALVNQTISDYSTPWGNAIARFIVRLGSWTVYLPVATAVLGTLLWRRRLRAAAHWIAALLFGGGVTVLLAAVPLLPPPVVLFRDAPDHLPRDFALAAIVYGYAAALFASLRPVRVHMAVYAGAAALVLLIGLSRLILAQDWLGLNLFQLVIALLWIGALTLGYRQHRPERLFAGSFGLPVLAAFLMAVSVSWGLERAAPPEPQRDRIRDLPVQAWWSGGWKTLPAARIDVRGRELQYFDFQWAGPLDRIAQEMEAAGWQRMPALKPLDTLRWFTGSTPVAQLMVLPQVHAGHHARLTMRQPIDDDRQRLVRLWDSDVRLTSEEGAVPVWLGAVIEQRARTTYRLFRYPMAEPVDLVLPPLSKPSAQTAIRIGDRNGRRLWLLGPPVSDYTSRLSEPPDAAPVPLAPGRP